jgi:hypothetical protein
VESSSTRSFRRVTPSEIVDTGSICAARPRIRASSRACDDGTKASHRRAAASGQLRSSVLSPEPILALRLWPIILTHSPPTTTTPLRQDGKARAPAARAGLFSFRGSAEQYLARRICAPLRFAGALGATPSHTPGMRREQKALADPLAPPRAFSFAASQWMGSVRASLSRSRPKAGFEKRVTLKAVAGPKARGSERGRKPMICAPSVFRM